MSTITLEQFEQILKTNVLTDPPMWVRNASFPRGQISFRVLGSDFRMRDVIIPVSGSAVDLTTYAPIQNLLASAELRAVFASKQLKLINPEDMPEPTGQKFPQYTGVQTPVVAGTSAVLGSAPEGTQVQTIIDGDIYATIVATGTDFSLSVPALTAGQKFDVAFMKENFENKKVSVTVAEKPDQPFPQPTVNEYTQFDPTITGTTIAGATVKLLNDGAEADSTTADDQGAFTLNVPNPHGVIEIVFSAEGYTSTTVTPAPKDREVNVTADTPKYLDTTLNLNIDPVQPAEFGVEIEIDGQPLINVNLPAGMTTYAATVQPIKGNVKVTVKSTGYKETSITRTPTKNDFGQVIVNTVHAEESVISGNVALRDNADDVKVEVVTPEKTYNGDVDQTGGFSVPTDSLNAGDASVHFTSEHFNEKTQDFDILAKEIPAPTINEVFEGDTEISGTTLEGVKVVYGAHETVAVAGGAFTLTTDALEASDIVLQFSKTNYATKDVTVSVAPLIMQAEPTAQTVYVGETDIHGTAEPGSEIFIDNNSVGTVEPTGDFTLSGPALSSAETLTFRKHHYKEETLVVTPQPLSNFAQPTLTITEGDSQITGTTEANATVTCTDATAPVTANESGAFTLVLKAAAAADQEFEIGFAKRGFANATYEYTAVAKPAEPA